MRITDCWWACWASASSLASVGIDHPENEQPADSPENVQPADPLLEEEIDSGSMSEILLLEIQIELDPFLYQPFKPL